MRNTIRFPQDHPDYIGLKQIIIQHTFSGVTNFWYKDAQIYIDSLNNYYLHVELAHEHKQYLYFLKELISNELGYRTPSIEYSMREREGGFVIETSVIEWNRDHGMIREDLKRIAQNEAIETFDIDYHGNDDLKILPIEPSKEAKIFKFVNGKLT